MDANNDGAVTLESQLDYRAQRQARAIYGFNENHVKVLFSDDVIDIFNDILRQRAEEMPKRRFFKEVFSQPPPDANMLKSNAPGGRDLH
jgi:hypothetical protein